MAPRKSKEVKQAEARINSLYAKFCHGIQVPIFSLSGIFKAGLVVALSGGTDEQVGAVLRDAALLAAGGKPDGMTVEVV